MQTKNTHGGNRKGAGRKKSAPVVKHQININAAVFAKLKAKYSTKEINRMIRDYLAGIKL